MKKLLIILLLVGVVLLSSSSALSEPSACSSCEECNEFARVPNSYIVPTLDLKGCDLSITNNNITFDCQGHTIECDSIISDKGIIIFTSKHCNYSSIQNCVIKNCNMGIFLRRGCDHSYIYNNTLEYNVIGIRIDSTNNLLVANRISSNQHWDIQIPYSFLNNTGENNTCNFIYYPEEHTCTYKDLNKDRGCTYEDINGKIYKGITTIQEYIPMITVLSVILVIFFSIYIAILKPREKYFSEKAKHIVLKEEPMSVRICILLLLLKGLLVIFLSIGTLLMSLAEKGTTLSGDWNIGLVLLLAWTILHFVALWGVIKLSSWGRLLGIIISIEWLAAFPLGTILALILLYFLLIDEKTIMAFKQVRKPLRQNTGNKI